MHTGAQTASDVITDGAVAMALPGVGTVCFGFLSNNGYDEMVDRKCIAVEPSGDAASDCVWVAEPQEYAWIDTSGHTEIVDTDWVNQEGH